MPLLGRAKHRIGRQLAPGATAGEGAQNMLGAYIAAGALAGLLANTLFALWWLDPAIALGIAALGSARGRQAWQGDGCACAPIPGRDHPGGTGQKQSCG